MKRDGTPREFRNRISSLVAFVMVLSTVIGFNAAPAEAVDYYVAVNHPNASDSNDGLSLDQPFKTLQRAVQPLSPGDTLFIKAGTYREVLSLGTDGTAAAPISVVAYPGDEGNVIIRGSDVVTGWSYDGSGVWSVPWQPLPLIDYPPGYPDVDEYAQRREMVFVDGLQFTQVLSGADLENGSFWMDDASQRLRISFSGDPNVSQVEIAVRTQGVMARGRSHLSFRGLRVDHVSTELWFGAMSLGPNTRVEDCTVTNNNGHGITADSQSLIISTKSNHNGRLGLGLSGNDSTLESSETSYNSWRYGAWACGGVKVVSEGTASGNRFTGHTSRYNNGPGIAFDTVGSGNIVEASYFEGNKTEVVFEAAIGPNWIINNIVVVTVGSYMDGSVLKGVGVRVWTARDTYIYNNTVMVDMVGTGVFIGGGERYSGNLHFYTANTKVYNNIVLVQPDERLVQISVWGLSGTAPMIASNRFDNNLYFGDDAVIWLSGPYTLSEWQSSSGEDMNSLFAPPMFNNLTARDFSLQIGSPALDAGMSIPEVIEDFRGGPRPLDLNHDIGAFECPVDEGCVSLIFGSGFEGGDLSDWTTTS